MFMLLLDSSEGFFHPKPEIFQPFPAQELLIDGVSPRRFPICYNKLRRRASRWIGLLSQCWTREFASPGSMPCCEILMPTLFMPLPYNNLVYSGLQPVVLAAKLAPIEHLVGVDSMLLSDPRYRCPGCIVCSTI